MLVQIYETTTPDEAAALAQMGVDHVGVLVGWGEFSREVSPQRAATIFARLPNRTKGSALLLSGEIAAIVDLIETASPGIIHLGAAPECLSVEAVRALKERYPTKELMRSIPVVDQGSLALARAYDGIADWLLLDSHKPGDTQIGAAGRTHDWHLSQWIASAVATPVLLAGGLGPENIQAAIRTVRPAGVDSKSWTDRPDGRGKDLERVQAFVARAKGSL